MNERTESMKNKNSINEELNPTVIMQNVYSVFPSMAMLAGMELDVFTPLKDGPLDAKNLADALNVQEDKLMPLLYALVVADLLKLEGQCFSNTDEATHFLVQGRPGYIGGLNGFFKMLIQISMKTTESIRTGKPQAKFDFHSLSEEELAVYFRKQVHSSRSGGKEIAEKIDFSGYENLLDAGGGSGGVSMALCTRYPSLKATVADLPKVVKLAEQFIAEESLSNRISVSSTDLSIDSPPGEYDVAILRALIQTLSKENAQNVLLNIGRSLLPGGRILIFGNVLNDTRLGPSASIAYGLVFLNTYDDGKAYTEEEYREMLENAGFKHIVIDHDFLTDGMGLVSAIKQ